MDPLHKAADILKRGDVVAIPTETVYGLAADATNDQAVAKIFAAKNRPTFNPLIIHGHSAEHLSHYVDFTDTARKLADTFWPGPLTLILKRRADSSISLLASAGLETLGVRVPNHALTRQLIKDTCLPLAAPSANASGRISPTRAEDVDLAIPYVLDGGPCDVGVESTILDLSTDQPTLLRPGGISLEDLENTLQEKIAIYEGSDITAPGQLSSHYAPCLSVKLNVEHPASGETYLAFGPTSVTGDHVLNLSEAGDLNEAAANLFWMMRQLDQPRFSCLSVAPIPHHGLGRAINDRLTRAAAPR